MFQWFFALVTLNVYEKTHQQAVIPVFLYDQNPKSSTPEKNPKLEDDWPESIFPQVLIQPRRHLFTSLRRACLRAAMLSVYGHMRAPSHHPTFLSNCAARFLTAQARCACALRKLVCASCSAPALCKVLCASALSKLLCARALRQLLRASALRMCSVQVGLCKLLCASALCNCSVQVALRKLLCASDSVQVALRKSAAAAGVCSAYYVCT